MIPLIPQCDPKYEHFSISNWGFCRCLKLLHTTKPVIILICLILNNVVSNVAVGRFVKFNKWRDILTCFFIINILTCFNCLLSKQSSALLFTLFIINCSVIIVLLFELPYHSYGRLLKFSICAGNDWNWSELSN